MLARKPLIKTAIPPGMAIYNDAGTAPAASDVKEVADKLAKAFEDFKAQHNAQLAELKKGSDDVVTREHVDRVNAAVGDMSKELEDVQRRIAAMAAIGNDNRQVDPVRRAHATAFRNYLRKGIDDGLRELEVKAALSTDSNQDGGFISTPESEGPMTRVLETVSAMRRMCNIVRVSGDGYKKLHNLGGTGSGWVGETDSRSGTATPQLVEMRIYTGEIYAMPAATQKMLDDGMLDVESWLGGEVAITFAEQESPAFISGNGVNKPKGFLAYDTVANASYAWGKLGFIKTGASASFASSDPADALIDLYHSLKQGYRAGAEFIMNDATLAAVRKFKDGQGNYLYGIPSATEPGNIMGKTVQIDDNMPDLGANNFPVAFGDFRAGYTILDRTDIRVLRDPFSSKPYVLFYTTKRVGGGVTDYAAIKLLKCST